MGDSPVDRASSGSAPVDQAAANRPGGAAASALRLWRLLTAGVIACTLATMVLGPLVRAEGAGLACPDWPLCHGRLVPDFSDHRVFLEWFHRLVGGLTSLAFAGWLGVLLLRRPLRAAYWFPALLAVTLLVTQILLGMLTITEQLDAYVVKSHLLNAVLFLSVLVYLHRKTGRDLRPGHPDVVLPAGPVLRRARLGVGALTLAIFLQLFLGGRVSVNHAGLVCPHFPACYQEEQVTLDGTRSLHSVYFPPMIGNVEKHMTHRFMAYAIAVFCVILVWRAARWLPLGERLAWALAGLVFTQILLGVINVLYHVPTPITVAHSSVAYLIFLTAFTLWLELLFDGRNA